MEVLRHSGLGISSFVTSIATGVLMFVLVVYAGYLEVSTPGGMNEESLAAIVIGLLVFVFVGTGVVGLILGICSLFQKDRKKVFGAIGTGLSVLVLLGIAALMVIGSSV